MKNIFLTLFKSRKMAISNRPTIPNIESFINKGGSSTVAEELLSPTPVVREKAARAPKKVAAAPVPTPARPKGRPRKPAPPAEALKFVMRIPAEIAAELDRRVENRKVPTSRNAWILEAIVARFEAEK